MKSNVKPLFFSLRTSGYAAAICALISSQPLQGATLLWNGNSSVDINWSTPGNWTPAGPPGATDTAVFGATATSANSVTVNNTVSASTTVSALSYTNTTSGAWHVTDIPAGVTLTATNVTMGGINNVNSLTTSVALTDGGTLLVYGNLSLGNSGSSSLDTSTVDLSGLSNFVYIANPGTIALGIATRSAANFLLASASNSITATTINDNTPNTSNTGTANLTLGAGTNLINAGTFNIAAGRTSSTLSFPAGSTGGLRLRGLDGSDTSTVNMTLGNHNTAGSGSTCSGTLSLNGNPVDMRFGTLTVGASSSGPTGNSAGNGTVSFDTGRIYVSNLVMAVSSGSSTFAIANGTINVGPAGTLVIGAGGASLANQGAASGTATGNLNLNGGTVICSNNLIKTTSAGVGNLTINSGTLNLVAGTVGTAAIPLDTVSLGSGSLQLGVDGNSGAALIYGTAVSAGALAITITSVTNVPVPKTIPLISYNPNNGDPFSGLSLAGVPAGYNATLVDNTGGHTVDLSISPNVTVPSLFWVGAVGSTVNSSWDKGTTANWRNGLAPSTYVDPDLAHFDDSASNSTVTVTTTVGPGVFTVTNSGLNYTFGGSGAITGNVALVKAGAGSLALTETGGDSFSLGLNVVQGTVILDDANSALAGGTTVGAGATLQIGNNDVNGGLPAGTVAVDGSLVFKRTDSVLVAAAITGAGTLTQNGAGKLTLSAANQYSGSTAVLQGTLALSAAGTISNSAAVSVTGGTLDVSGVAGSSLLNSLSLANSSVTVALGGSTAPINVLSGVSLSGSGNSLNVATLPPIASYPATFTIIQSGGGLSGTFNVTAGTFPAATPPYAGTVSASPDNLAVLLTVTAGPVGVRPSVLWIGTNSVSATTNWSDRLNWQLPGAPGAADNVLFAANGAGTASPFSAVGDGPDGLVSPQNLDNVVDASVTVSTLTFTNLGGSYHNTLIADGASLTVVSNGSLTVGSSAVDFGSGVTEFVTIAGTNGTLNVNNTNGTLFVGLGNSGGQATLDLSGLGTFNASVSRFFVGVGSGSAGIPVARESGVLYLAKTNTITAGIAVSGTETSDTSTSALAIDVGDDDGNAGAACFLYLGQTNAIFADAIGIARQKPNGTMRFNPNLINNNTRPAAYFRGASASAMAIWSLGDQVVNSGSGESPSGTNDFTGGYVNALVGTLYAGRVASNNSGAGTANGVLTFDSGIFNVGTLYAGYQPATSVKNANGIINVQTNATLGTSGILVVSSNLNLAVTTGGTGAPITTGTLNIDGGTVAANNIVCGGNGAPSTITLGASGYGGGLIVSNTLGSPATPLTALNLTGGTLQLSVNGSSPVTNVVAAAVTSSGPTTLKIGSVVNGTTGFTYPLISYTGTDPFSSLTLGPLPPQTAGSLVDDTAHGLIGITFTAVPPPAPRPAVITTFSVSGATLNLTATNGVANGRVVLLGTTNVALPVSAWTPVLTNTFNGSGNLNLSTNIVNPASSREFYLLSQ